MKLSIIVPTIDGEVPASLESCAATRPDVEVVVVKGVSPVGCARNEGLRRARGEYIAWVDADDEIYPEYFAEILGALGADVVVLDCVRGETELKWAPSGKGVLSDLLAARGKLSAALWRFVIRRELWEGVSFDERLTAGEDYDVLPELLVKAKSVAKVGTIYHYVQRRDSLSHQRSAANRKSRHLARWKRIKRWLFSKYWREVIIEAVKSIWWEGKLRIS